MPQGLELGLDPNEISTFVAVLQERTSSPGKTRKALVQAQLQRFGHLRGATKLSGEEKLGIFSIWENSEQLELKHCLGARVAGPSSLFAPLPGTDVQQAGLNSTGSRS